MHPMVTTPPRLIQWSALFTHHFAIAPYILGGAIAIPPYRGYVQLLRYFANRGDWITVDNGVTETGEAASFNHLVEAALAVGAMEIVIPDVFNNGPATLELLEACYDQVRKVPQPGKFMVVAHGNTLAEIQDMIINVAAMYPAITTIGIPKVLTRNLRDEGGRAAVLEWLKGDKLLRDRFTFHLLGVWEDIGEVANLHKNDLAEVVRSIDTSWPIMAAWWDINMMRFPELKVPWNVYARTVSEIVAIDNLTTYARWATGGFYWYDDERKST